jgi:glycosyltransferase involved in cell wall biosynthesis
MSKQILSILSASDGVSLKSRANFLYQTTLKTSKSEKEELRNKLRYGGHRALRDNLIAGLRYAGIEFELSNQIPLNQNNVGLLAGKQLLRKLTQDRKRKIENIVVGPNLFVTPKGFELELQSELIRHIVVPSKWVADYWAYEMPEISHKIFVWTVGVDFNYWQPLRLKQETLDKKVIVYVKNQDELLVDQVELLLKKNGFPVSIITYGLYSEEHYRNELRNCIALVYIGKSESQGIALLEAWAMDVPTFVYNSKKAMIIPSKFGEICLQKGDYSTAPYLTDERGHFWVTINELESHLIAAQRQREKFAPRKNSKMFSAENCAIEYSKLFGS